jgi:putative ABC transport system permease protein
MMMFRYTLRALTRDRAFAGMVVFSLALGIGANTAIFSLVNGVLLRPPDYRQPDRVVAIDQVIPKFARLYPALPINPGILMEWRRQAKSFESIGMMQPSSFNITGGGEPELLTGARVSANLFTVLGVQPRLGRTFLESEDASGRDRVAILADSLWRRRFHSDPSVVGGKILLDGSPYEVVGVLPPSFQMPEGINFISGRTGRSEIFRPIGYKNDDLKLQMEAFNYWAIARLKPGVSAAQANSELNVIQSSISARIPEAPDLHASVTPILDRIVGKSRKSIVLVMAAVGAVLLILWVNLANLSLVRAAGRARDYAIRAALGAGRASLVRQSLAESMALSVTGGALGVLLAWWGVRALLAAAPIDLPRLNEVTVDGRVLLFAVALSLAAGLVLGVVPALRSAAAAPYETLKSASRGSTEGRGGMRVRNTLVALEVGLSAMLLVTAGLLTASFIRVMTVDKGFDVDRVLAVDVSLPAARYQENSARAGFFKRAMDAASALPGAQNVSLVSALPLAGEVWIDVVGTEHDPRPFLERPSTNVRFISPSYFKTLRVPMKEGRDFEETDRGRPVVIISAGLAQKLWPGQDALGRKLDDGGRTLEVVGVTPDFRSTSLDHDPVNMTYIPYWQRPRLSASILIRTAMDPLGIAGAMRKSIWALDSEVPIPEIRTLNEMMSRSVADRRFQMLLVALFAAAALSLAGLGTYGVVSYAVARRRSEMGIRMALGAARSNVLRMVLGQGMAPVVAGLALGAGAAFVLGRYLASLLFEISPRDPLAFGVASGVLLIVAAAACLVPARRATRVNPVEALRFE